MTPRWSKSQKRFCLLFLASIAFSPAFAGPKKESSVSCGAVNKGRLLNASELSRAGVGFVIPKPWYRRGRRFGSDSMISLIVAAAKHVEKTLPEGTLAVADISQKGGGAIGLHKSHQSGRDVDLIFYALDDKGDPFRPDSHMAYYGELGEGLYSKAPMRSADIKRRFFDLARNWQLISYLAKQQKTPVTHVFVSSRVKRWLLQYAKSLGEPKELIKRVNVLLKKDKKGLHNDHFHVRIGCDSKSASSSLCHERRSKTSLTALKHCATQLQ